MRQRLLLITPTSCYQIGRYLAAARCLDIDVHLACNQSSALNKLTAGRNLQLDFADHAGAVRAIAEHAASVAFDALLGVDEQTCEIAAQAAAVLKLTHNPPTAVATAHNKYLLRRHLADAGLPCPGFRLISPGDDLEAIAEQRHYPCVLKPLQLSASRGVLRTNNRRDFLIAAKRIEHILQHTPDQPPEILVEDFIPGLEFALEGLLENGHLHRLAIFDKPEPLDGPVFEESIYVTPSRLSEQQQRQLFDATASICTSLDLQHGPIHAELRLNAEGVWLIDIATRSIGGRCSGALRFGNGVPLEELILRNALGQPTAHLPSEPGANGVMMIPIPAAGRLQCVTGLASARRVSGITAISIDIANGAPLVPLPEGDRYLGFIFAHGPTPAQVIASLKQSHALLHFEISAQALLQIHSHRS